MIWVLTAEMLLDRRVRREVVPKARSTGRGGNRGGERGQESWVDSLPLRQTDLLCPGTFFLLITEDDMRRCGYLRIKSPPSPEVQGASWVMMGAKWRDSTRLPDK